MPEMPSDFKWKIDFFEYQVEVKKNGILYLKDGQSYHVPKSGYTENYIEKVPHGSEEIEILHITYRDACTNLHAELSGVHSCGFFEFLAKATGIWEQMFPPKKKESVWQQILSFFSKKKE